MHHRFLQGLHSFFFIFFNCFSKFRYSGWIGVSSSLETKFVGSGLPLLLSPPNAPNGFVAGNVVNCTAGAAGAACLELVLLSKSRNPRLYN